MKNVKKKLLIVMAPGVFALLMMFNLNVSLSEDGSKTDINLSTIEAMAYEPSSDCHDGDCNAICGDAGTSVCTGMDCGSGTQLCMRY